ncbi:MAG: NUDIX hydrolase [Actinomycetota bacterium]
MQDFTVASGIIVDGDRMVFVQNRRRNGSLDWSTPGGVVDPGEEVLEALGREVVEETALHVDSWSPLLYSVDVDFVGRDLTLHAEVFRAERFRGELHIDDPDHVVVDGRWVDHAEAVLLLGQSPAWVAEPLTHALASLFGPTAPPPEPAHWRYEAVGGSKGFTATRLDGPA